MKLGSKKGLYIGLLLLFVGMPWYLWLKAKQAETVDFIIFSYDRPLQLYALLESTEQYMTGLGKTIIIYRSSNTGFHAAYDQVHTAFPWAEFWEQGVRPQADFKPLTMKALISGPSNYILFAVDDIVVKDYVDLTECVKALETTNTYGFYLRLGTHLNYCYSCSAKQLLPPFFSIGTDKVSWMFGQGTYDWGYPNTVDMTIYRKAGVIKDFDSFWFTNPNTLEGNWAMLSGRIAQSKGQCFTETKIVNLPFNLVQKTCQNPNMNSFSPQEFLEIFNKGLKLDIQPLFKIKNKSAHMEYEPTFIAR